MDGILAPHKWVLMLNKQGRITYVGKTGLPVKDPMTITTKNLMNGDEVLLKAQEFDNATPFDMDKHLLEGAE